MGTVGSLCRSDPSELRQQSLLTFLLRVYAMTTGQASRLTENQGVHVFLMNSPLMWQRPPDLYVAVRDRYIQRGRGDGDRVGTSIRC